MGGNVGYRRFGNGKSPERMVADNIIITMDVIIVFSEYRQALV